MKAMRRVSRGTGFRGVLDYTLENGRLIGGNMDGRNARELASEFGATRRLRPDIEKPVWHSSLRLPKGERLTEDQWNRIAADFRQGLGFTPQHLYAVVLHDDPEGQHIHMIQSRVALDRRIYLGQNENFKSTDLSQALEIAYGLTRTKGPERTPEGKVKMPERKQPSKNEVEQALRTGQQPPRVELQQILEAELSGRPSMGAFIERLQERGVNPVPNVASTGRMNGFSFEFRGIAFKASELGDKFKWPRLEKGLDYDQVRDASLLTALRDSARARQDRGRAAEADRGAAAPEADRRGPGAAQERPAERAEAVSDRTAAPDLGDAVTAAERPGERQEHTPGRDGLEARADGPGSGLADGRDALDAEPAPERGSEAPDGDGREVERRPVELEQHGQRGRGAPDEARIGHGEGRDGGEEPAVVDGQGMGRERLDRRPSSGAYGRILELSAATRTTVPEPHPHPEPRRPEPEQPAPELARPPVIEAQGPRKQEAPDPATRRRQLRELRREAEVMPLAQLAQAVAQPRPPSVETVIGRDPALKEASKALKELNKQDGILQSHEVTARAHASRLEGSIAAFNERHGWFGRLWHRGQLRELQALCTAQHAEAEKWAVQRQDLGKERQAAAKALEQVRETVRARVEPDARHQVECYEVLEQVHTKRVAELQRQQERERPPQQRDKGKERGRGGGMER